jgi:hypothetical protein
MTRITSKQVAQMKNGKFIVPERRELHSFIRWVKLAHPKLLYYFDYAADSLLTPRQAKERKDLSTGDKWPDIFFPEPRGPFYGLYIELKREDVKIYNNKGLCASDHLQRQADMLDKLRDRGYYCSFAKGAAAARLILTQYLNLKT